MNVPVYSSCVDNGDLLSGRPLAIKQPESGCTGGGAFQRLSAWLSYGLAILLLTGLALDTQAQALPCGYRTLTTNNFANAGVVDSRTGGTGTIVVIGGVDNPGNVVNNTLTDFANIRTVLGVVGNGGQISVSADQNGTNSNTVIGAGATAGYVVGSNTLLAANLLGATTISTYLNGTFQESASGSSLLNLVLLSGSGQTTLGFVTTKNFDEVQISISTVLSVATNTRVFYPFVQYASLLVSASGTSTSGPAVSDGVVSVTATGGLPPYSYRYTGPNTSATTSSSTLTGRAPGSYTVTVTDASGCTAVAVATVVSPTPFTCAPNIGYLVNSSNSGSTASRINLTTGVSTVVATNIAGNLVVNPLGFNPTDNYLWGAFRSTANTLVRFDANFSPTYYTATIPAGVNSGDISPNGVFYLYNGNAGNTTAIQRVDLSSGTPTALTNLNLTSGITIGDFAFNPVDNNLYALTSTRILYRILIPTSTTATSATLVNLGTATLTPAPSNTTFLFGAAYTDSNGNFYALDNNSGITYRINTVNTLTTNQGATATRVSSNTALIATDTDGARCPTAQVAAEASFSFNCGGSTTSTGSFIANGGSSQSGTITIPITGTVSGGASAGIASFTVLTAGFSANPALYTTTLTAGQTSVTIPIVYDGTGAPGSRTLVIDSEQAVNQPCSRTITVQGQPDLTTSFIQPPALPIANQANSLPIIINNIGNISTSGIVSSVISIPASVTVPATFTSNGFSCTTSGTLVSCTSSAVIASGASTTLAVPFTPNVAAIGTFLSFTNIVATANERSTTNNTATITVTPAVAGQPDLTTSISQPVPALVAGQTSSLPISVSNIGTAATSDLITQTIAIPASVTAPAAFTSNGFSCTTSGSLVSCTSTATLATGTSTTFAVPITALTAGAGTSQVFSTTVATNNESNVNNNTATLTAGISASVTAGPDSGTVSSGTGGTAVANVTTNDIVNGAPATLGGTVNATIAVVGTYPAGITLNTTTGSVSVAIGTTPGSYTLAYQLCDRLTTPTCTTGQATVLVTPSISASADAGTASAGTGGTAVANVRANDVVNGQPATTANSSLSLVSTSPGITLNTTTGSVSVAQGTAPGSYTLVYQLCSTLGSTTCTTSFASVTVTPSVTAAPDAGTASSGTGGNAVVDVRTNDLVNGALPTTANSTLTLINSQNAGITLNTVTGSVSVVSGTTPGSYTLSYQLCDKLTPTTCATAVATITVTASLTANTDSGTASSGTGGTAVANVRANDFVNSQPATSANSSLSLVSSQNPGITLNTTTGSVSVAQGTAPGSYTLTYQLCSTQGSTTCTTGLVSVTVTPSITATPDAGTALATGGTAITNVTTNDVVNGATPILSGGATNATLSLVSSQNAGITLNTTTGSVSVATGTAPGTYTLVYQICTIATPIVCTTTTATVTVQGPDLTIAIGQPTPGLLVGQTSNVPVTVSNIGAVPTQGPVSFTLAIPATITASATFTSNGFTCTTSGTLVSCNSSAVIANATSTTVQVPITPLATSAGTSYTLSATVATVNESNLNNNTATTTVGPVSAPDLTILIGQASPALVVGQTSNVPVTISNIGTAPTAGPVSFTLSVPASVTVPATFTSGNFGCVTSGTLVSCSSSATITNGASTTISVPITPLPAAAGTSPVLSATVAVANEGNPNNNTAATTVTPAVVAPDLTVSIGQPSPVLTIGIPSTVPILVSNIGTSPTSGLVSFTLSIPASTTAPGSFSSGGFACVTSGTSVSCSSSATIVNGGNVTVSVPVTATATVPGVDPVFSATVITANESNPNNNTATTTASSILAPDLTVSINQPSPVLVAGQSSAVRITINNIGNATTLTPVSFTLSIPANVTASATFTSNGFTCTTSGTLVSCSSSAAIASGTSTTLAIPITPLNAAVGTSPVLSGTVATTGESNVNNNTATITVTTPVAGQPDLIVAIGQPSPNLVVGQVSNVPVSLSNVGTAPTSGPVNFTLSIPANVTASATFTSNGFTCATSGTLVSCSSPASITNGASTTVLVPITPLAASTGTNPVLSATVATGNESNPNNNTTTTTVTTPVIAPDLIIAIGQASPNLIVGQTSSLPVSLTNIGTAPTSGLVSFTLSVPASLTAPATFTNNGYTCTTSGTLVSCSSSVTLTNNASTTVLVPITPLTASASTSQILSATVATANESNVNNNTATTSVAVSASVVATADSGTASAGTGGTAVADVRTNDLVNGVLPTTANSSLSLVSSQNPGITLNTTTGSVSVAQGTAPGSYTLAYRLCDLLTPTTCATSLATITVTASVSAGPDSGTASAGTGGIAVTDVRTNDLVNGVTSTSVNSTLTLVSTSPGITFNTATGSVSVAQGTAPGSYTLVYQLCDRLTPITCTTALAAITVTASVSAGPDSGTASAGTGGVAVTDVRTNDLVNGVTSTSANSTLLLVNSQNPGIILNTTTGSVSVAIGTTPGSYTLVYQLCDKLTNPTCTTGLATITVTPSVTASPDAGTANTGTGTIAVADVRTNDLVNGALPTTANSSLSLISTSAGITLNTATGSVSVAQGTAPGSYTLTYQLCSTLGSTTCTTSFASVTVTGSSPVATPDIANTRINTPVSGNVITNDIDPQGLPLTASLLTPPASGTVVINPDGSYTYTPPTNFTGTVSFCYSVSNTAGLSGSACVSVNVAPGVILGNNAPIANNDNTKTTQNTPVNIVVLANDTDPDSETTLAGQLANPVILSQPAQGTAVVNANGTVTYTPPTNFTGVVSFPYQVCDKATPALCATATVSINVQPTPPVGTPQSPVAVDDVLFTKLNTPKTGNVSLNDSDPQGLTLTYTTNQPTSGTVVMSPAGSYTYTPAPGFTGPTRFTYSVCNSAGKCALATTSVLVQALAPQISLLPQVYLQGALFGVISPDVLMRDDLRSKGYIPLAHPYAYLTPLTATAPMNPSVTAVTGNDAIVDWVFVELRDSFNPSIVVDSRAALLQRDGDIVDVDGVSPALFGQANPGSYYVAVRHRNHLGVMSQNALPLSSATTTVDFRRTDTPTFTYTGTTSYTQVTLNQAQVVVQQGVAMWAGNALIDNAATAPHNSVIFQGSSNDVNVIYSQIIDGAVNPLLLPSFRLRGYFGGDINLNGETIFQGTGNDVEFIYQNVINNHPGNVLKLPNYIIREQLP